jgi:hypothetical protein
VSGVTVQGQVVEHESGDPLKSATVSLGAGPGNPRGRGTRVTDEAGRFLFRDVPPASYRLIVSLAGFRDLVDTLEVTSDRGLELVLPLSSDPIRLEPVVTEASRSGEARSGERKPKGGGPFVITREEIRQERPEKLTDMLRSIPGGRVVQAAGYGNVLLLRGGCLPGVWIDGGKIHGMGSLDELLPPSVVERIEVYHGFDLPVEFGVDHCGGIVIRTRTGTPAPTDTEGGSHGWRRLGIAVAFVALAIFGIVR